MDDNGYLSAEKSQSLLDRESRLQEDYKLLNTRWSELDNRALTVKGWTVVGAVATFIAVTQPSDFITKIWLSSIIAILLISIWFMEAQWKSIQGANRTLLINIENYFGGAVKETPQPHQLTFFWGTAYGPKTINWKELKRNATDPLVAIPYLPIIILLIVNLIFFKSINGK